MDFLGSLHGVGGGRKAQTTAPHPKMSAKLYRYVGVFLRRFSRAFFRTRGGIVSITNLQLALTTGRNEEVVLEGPPGVCRLGDAKTVRPRSVTAEQDSLGKLLLDFRKPQKNLAAEVLPRTVEGPPLPSSQAQCLDHPLFCPASSPGTSFPGSGGISFQSREVL